MPLIKSGSDKATEENFKEFRHGSKFKRTSAKFGKEKARKQMIAAVLSNKRRNSEEKSGRTGKYTHGKKKTRKRA